MAKEFVTFKKFNDQVAALELGTMLEEANIEYQLEDTSANFDVSFANNELSKEFRIKLRKEDFESADALLQKVSLAQIETVDKDYYLFGFTDEELMDVVSKKDEWGEFNFLLAQKILKERGHEIKPMEVELLKEQRIEELAKPEENQNVLIYFAYIISFLGGLLGLLIGWHLLTDKKTLPNGDRIYSYSQSDREHGNRIVIMGAIFFVFWFIAIFWKYK